LMNSKDADSFNRNVLFKKTQFLVIRKIK